MENIDIRTNKLFFINYRNTYYYGWSINAIDARNAMDAD